MNVPIAAQALPMMGQAAFVPGSQYPAGRPLAPPARSVGELGHRR
ncbi:hypothetical protein N0M98_13955 [Paenibacillus doosanensis]|nr:MULTISPECIES: hypothetical protein [Paenibacillus]MCS7461250.1 hypothetical protein [Paenibacillus doosanensis]